MSDTTDPHGATAPATSLGQWQGVWTEADVLQSCKTAFLSGWNAARNFPALELDAAWEDWLDYLKTTDA